MADKHLSLEMKERPVVYGRQPSWHKYNVIGGWPKRIEGNMIRINRPWASLFAYPIPVSLSRPAWGLMRLQTSLSRLQRRVSRGRH
jgi:hypothetical protein